MFEKLILVRFSQIKRSLYDFLIIHYLLSLVFIFIVALSVYASLKLSVQNRIYFVFVLFFFMGYIQTKRKDTIFLQILSQNSVWIQAFEFTFWCLPIIVFFFFNHWYFEAIALQSSCFILPFILVRSPYLKFNFDFFSKILPVQAFEWISGMRKSGVIVLLLLFASVISVKVKYLNLVFLYLYLSIVIGFFSRCEPISILQLFNEKPAVFLKSKIKTSALIYCCAAVPILILNTFIYPDFWIVGLVFLIFSLIMIANAILIKYANYTPDANLGASNLTLNLALLSGIFPLLFPLVFYIFFKNLSLSKRVLQEYLY